MTEADNPKDTHRVGAVILAAGLGTRMKSDLPKVLHPIAGRPMILHLMASLNELEPARTVVVTGPGMDAVREAVAPALTAIQDPPQGTGHAVLSARQAMEDFDGDVLVLFGADPLVKPETLRKMLAARRGPDDPAVVVLGFRPDDPAAYGRLIQDGEGRLDRIVEFKDATPEEATVGLCNAGVMAIDGKALYGLLDRVGNDNAKSEYYLTDIVAIARADGRACAVVEGDPEEVFGVNSRAELAFAEAVAQRRLREAAMEAGASLIDPDTVWFCHDTKLGRDVIVEPHVVFGPGVTVGDGVRIKAFSHLEGATVATAAEVGPYARLRPGAVIEGKAKIGNFVEVKNAIVEPGAKINHLSYVGDATVGAGANVGAGTITCNYDGFFKYRTEIGAGAFIGSNTALVAPVTIGEGAIVGAGSTISRDVAPDALAVTRAALRELGEWAAGFRSKKLAQKELRKRAAAHEQDADKGAAKQSAS